MAAIQTYRHSGKMGPAAIPYALGAGLVAGALSWVYQAVIDWIPYIYLTILATVGYGLAIGVAVAFAFRAGKGRNAAVAIGIAVLSCLVGDALSFHFHYERAMSNAAAEYGLGGVEGAVESMKEDLPLSEYVKVRAREGVTIGRSGKGLPIKGAMMWLVWGAEALILCALATGAQLVYLKRPFCEACDKLTDPRQLGAIPNVKTSALSAALAGGDLPALLDPPPEEKSGRNAAYTVHSCPTCDQRFLTVAVEWTERDKKGKEERKSEDLVQNAVVTPEQVETLKARLARGV